MHYFVSPWLLVTVGPGLLVAGVLIIRFRERLKKPITGGNRAMWGKRVGDRMERAPASALIAPGLGAIAFGILLLVLGIIGIVTNAPIEPAP